MSMRLCYETCSAEQGAEVMDWLNLERIEHTIELVIRNGVRWFVFHVVAKGCQCAKVNEYFR